MFDRGTSFVVGRARRTSCLTSERDRSSMRIQNNFGSPHGPNMFMMFMRENKCSLYLQAIQENQITLLRDWSSTRTKLVIASHRRTMTIVTIVEIEERTKTSATVQVL
jgi:hypothetical protein